jgi:hypothetical protein
VRDALVSRGHGLRVNFMKSCTGSVTNTFKSRLVGVAGTETFRTTCAMEKMEMGMAVNGHNEGNFDDGAKDDFSRSALTSARTSFRSGGSSS